MGEEEKKTEEKKMEEKKTEEAKKQEEEKKEKKEAAKKPEEKKPSEEGKKEEKKAEAAATEDSKDTAPPPQEIVLKVFMHCEGCARKVRRSLKGFDGVEDVVTDCKISKVVVKGEKADPLKVLQRVQRKSHRQVELISPIPKPPAEDEKKNEEKEKPKPEEKKEEPPVITAVLKVHMHCDACAQEIKKRILKMKGVESAEPDLKSSQVTVKGVYDPPKLVEYVYKRTGKHAIIVKQEIEKKEEEKGKEGKKGEGGGEKEKKAEEEKKEKKEGEEEKGKAAEEGGEGGGGGGGEEGIKVMDMKKNEFNSFYYSDPQSQYPNYVNTVYPVEYHSNNLYHHHQPPPPPQMFSDENPNACTVM